MKLMKNVLIIAALLALVGGTLHGAEDEHGGDEGHGDHEQAATGPHGGRLLADGDVTVELTIVEDGEAPEYRAWISRAGKPVAAGAQLAVELTRLGGEVNRFAFSPQGDFWRGDGEVTEPHSFDVNMTLTLDGSQYRWHWESYEGRTAIDPILAAEAGVDVAEAGPATIARTLTSHGRLVANPEKQVNIQARFPGLVKTVAVKLGDRVAAGATLAVVESNDSLKPYTITAPVAGVVTARHVNPGELTGDRALFEVSDFSQLWAELPIFPSQLGQVTPGQDVRLSVGDRSYDATLLHLLPGSTDAPFTIARAEVVNSDGHLAPGQWVSAAIATVTREVALAVDNRALQDFRDWRVVFVAVGDTYEMRPLDLGGSDGRFTEVLGGLQPGDRYVVVNSYLVKADIEKSGASHDH